MLPLPSLRERSCGNGSVCTGVLAAQIAGMDLSGDNQRLQRWTVCDEGMQQGRGMGRCALTQL